MFEANAILQHQIFQNTHLGGLHNLLNDTHRESAGLPKPDNEFYTTSTSQIFTGVTGEVDYFIFDTNMSGRYIVNNYEPESDWLIFKSDSGDSLEIASVEDRVTYMNDTDATYGQVNVNAAGYTSGMSILSVSGPLIFL